MSESTRKTFVIKAASSATSPPAPVGEPQGPPNGRRKLFQINSVAPQYQLPERQHILPNTTNSLAANLYPKASQKFRLYFKTQSFQQVERHVGWGQRTADNGVEQGGLLLGNAYIDPEQNLVFAIVQYAIAGLKARGSGAHLDMTHETWTEMLAQVDAITDANPNSGLQIVGWYHTHPNTLDVFMSGTDRNTQRTFFPLDWQFAVVLNPHRRLWRVYQGIESSQCEGFVMEEQVKQIPSDNVLELAEFPVGGRKRPSVSESPLSTTTNGSKLRLPPELPRSVTIALIVYALLVTALAAGFWYSAHRLKRQKVAAEKHKNLLGALPRASNVDGLPLDRLRNLIKEWRAESLNSSEHDQRILAEAERTLTDLLTRQRAVDVQLATPGPKVNYVSTPMPVDSSAWELSTFGKTPAPISVPTPVPSPPYAD